jgi:predicted nucleotidyltransferase
MNTIVSEDIKEKVIPVLKLAGIKKAALFGSYVRGEQTYESDVDILVEYPKGVNLFDVAGIKIELENALGKSVDLIGYKTIKPRIKHQILSEAQQIL